MNCSTPGLPVHHQVPEFTQTHVHRVGDAIQPSHPLLSPFSPAPKGGRQKTPSIRVFSNESTLRMRWPKYWSFSFSIIPSKEIPGLISFRWTGCAVTFYLHLAQCKYYLLMLKQLYQHLYIATSIVIFLAKFITSQLSWAENLCP